MLYRATEGYLKKPNAPIFILLVLIALYFPFMAIGLIVDDFYHFAMINNSAITQLTEASSLYGFFHFVDTDVQRTQFLIDQGLIPWWTADNFKFVFFRPLTELSLFIDYSLFASNTYLMHLHSILWKFLAAASVFYCTMQITKDRALSTLCTLLFAVDATHAITVGWLANRSALMAAAFGLLAVAFYLKALDNSRPIKYLIASMATMALALACGEIGVSFVAIMFCFAFLPRERPIYSRLILFSGPLALTLIYLAIYVSQGYGAGGDALLYSSPFALDSGFWQQLLFRVPALMIGSLGLLPADLYGATFSLSPGAVLAITGLIFLLLCYWHEIRTNRLIQVSLAALVFCCIPVAAKMPSDRNLFVATYPTCLFLAVILKKAISHDWSAAGLRLAFKKYTAAILFLIHIVLSAALHPMYAYSLHSMSDDSIRIYQSLPEDIEGKTLVFVDTPFAPACLATPVVSYLQRPLPAHTIWLSNNYKGSEINIDSSGSLTLTVPQGLLSNGDDTLFRSPQKAPLYQGEKIELPSLTIEIDAVTPDKRPMRLRATPTEPDNTIYLTFKKGKFRVIEPDKSKGSIQTSALNPTLE